MTNFIGKNIQQLKIESANIKFLDLNKIATTNFVHSQANIKFLNSNAFCILRTFLSNLSTVYLILTKK